MSAAGFTTNESSQVLLVSVHNVIYPITEYVLHRVFDPYGCVEKIDILQSSQLLQAVVQFDSCQNAVWAKSQLQGRYIYDGCCQLDIQFYKSFGNDNQTRIFLTRNEFASDLDFIKDELRRMIVITDRMQERIKTMNCSIQKYADAVSRSSQSTKLKVHSNTVDLKSSSVMSMSSSIVAPTPDLPPTSKPLNLTTSPAVPMKLLLTSPTKVAAPAKIFSPLAETKVSTTKEYAQTQVNLFLHLLSAFSGRMLSRIQCFEFGKLYPIVLMLGLMFDTNEYKVFGLMLERNGRKTLEKVVFIFDPGGVLRMSKPGPMKKYSCFSHRVQFDMEDSFYIIFFFPRKDEIWAVYLDLILQTRNMSKFTEVVAMSKGICCAGSVDVEMLTRCGIGLDQAGKTKIDVVVQTLSNINPDVALESYALNITSLKGFEIFIKSLKRNPKLDGKSSTSVDLVLNFVDNYEACMVVNHALFHEIFRASAVDDVPTSNGADAFVGSFHPIFGHSEIRHSFVEEGFDKAFSRPKLEFKMMFGYLNFHLDPTDQLNRLKNSCYLHLQLNYSPKIPHSNALNESKIYIFDPGGTFTIDSIYDLEDKVDFKGSVMIRLHLCYIKLQGIEEDYYWNI